MKILLGAVAALFLMASCSSSEDSKKISPKSTEFTLGDIADCIEVVDEPAELICFEEKGTYYLRLKVTVQMKADGIKDTDPQDIGFLKRPAIAIIDLLDEDNDEVASLGVAAESHQALQQLLTGEKGDKAEIIFEDYHHNPHMQNRFAEAYRFRPRRTADVVVYEPLKSSDNNNQETTSEWNQVLDQYEQYVDQYVATYKKAMDGDMSAMTDYVNLLDEAQKLSAKLENASSEMTEAQRSRYLEITSKLTDIANF